MLRIPNNCIMIMDVSADDDNDDYVDVDNIIGALVLLLLVRR